MSAIERQRKILQLVSREGSLAVGDLIGQLEASPATVRRDLVQLEEAGKLLRLHGAVMDRRRLEWEPSFSVKRQRIPEVKRRIGQAVAEFISPCSSVFVDAGTTCLEAGLALLRQGGHTLYTNSLPLLYHAGEATGAVIGIGGEVRALTGALVGGMALDWLNHLHFDYAVIGASGLDVGRGPLTTELSEAAVKKQAIVRARVAILAADTGKLEERADIIFAQWSDFHIWFSSGGLSKSQLKRIRTQNPSLSLKKTA